MPIPSIPNPSSVSLPQPNSFGTVPSQYNLPSTPNLRNAVSGGLNTLKSSIDNIKGKIDNNNIFKQVDQPTDFLKSQRDSLNPTKTSFNKSTIVSLLIPIISKFARVEYIAKLLISKLTKQTKEQVKNKGKLTIQGGTFTFTPSNPGNYEVFKNNFDRKVNSIKKALDDIQRLITLLNNIIRILNIALSITQIFIKLKLAKLVTQHSAVIADLASPSPSKTSGTTLLLITQDILKYENAQKKITDYQKVITSAQLYLGLFKSALLELRIKVNELQFNIVNDPNNILTSTPTSPVSKDLNSSLNTVQNSAPNSEEYVDAFGKSYTLKLVTLPTGAIQYQALDAFSKLKITQTAPSKTKTPDQLLEEIKQILG